MQLLPLVHKLFDRSEVQVFPQVAEDVAAFAKARYIDISSPGSPDYHRLEGFGGNSERVGQNSNQKSCQKCRRCLSWQFSSPQVRSNLQPGVPAWCRGESGLGLRTEAPLQVLYKGQVLRWSITSISIKPRLGLGTRASWWRPPQPHKTRQSCGRDPHLGTSCAATARASMMNDAWVEA